MQLAYFVHSTAPDKDLFSRISEAHAGQLTKEQFVYHLTNSDRIATCFSHLGINTETTNTDELWDLFDMDENGCIDQDVLARVNMQ